MGSSSILLFHANIFVLSTLLLCNTTLSKHGNYTDHQALLSLKASILTDPLRVTSSWNESIHFCEWSGITCGRKHKRVTKIDLHSSKLEGSLSPNIGNLSFLRELVLYDNNFRGVIPEEIGQLSRLHVLNLINNSFSGNIPKNISFCFNLIYLLLGHNDLTGRFPFEFQSLFKLQYLAVLENKLVGEMPAYIGNFTSLMFLSLRENYFQGKIPNSIATLNKLSYISLEFNNLSGTIPTSIFNLSSLEVFAVSKNQLRGYLPLSIASTLPNLEVLIVYANSLIGPLPKSISNLTKLKVLDVVQNGFTGGVPEFGLVKQLKYVGLSVNPLGDGKPTNLDFMSSLLNSTATLRSLLFFSCNLGGVLPKFIGNFSRLMGLAIYENLIQGHIPHEVQFLSDLEILDMSGNQLSGGIPSAMGSLPKLYSVDISGNKLSGEIPTSLGNISMLSLLYLSSNNLQGTIPSCLGKSRFLSFIDVSKNNLNGHLPKQLFYPTSSLIHVDLSCNYFTSHLPLEIGGLKILVFLNPSNNMLSGPIPNSLGTLSGLTYLNLSTNFFHGFIPPSFSSLKSLQSLDLSSNNLTGKVPTFLGELQYLKRLNLSFNHLEGEIPTEGIFKNKNDVVLHGNNLCGGIPQFGLPKCTREGERHHILSHVQKFGILFPSGIVIVTIVALVVFIYKRIKKQSSMLNMKIEFMPMLSYWSIQKATNGFSESNVIGSGKFSTVYKGVLNGTSEVIAIKVLKLQVRGASESFLAECKALRHIRHRNLVKVLTTCCSIDHEGNDFKAIVYEYMTNGCLENWMHNHMANTTEENHDSKNLNLLQRVNIAIDVANALEYLHNRLETLLVHCDLKPSNILLDEELVAHVGDFGLAKFLTTELTHAFSSNQMSSKGIIGTIGYTAPKYGMGSALSTFGDMYSYEILLLEIFTGKSPTGDIFNSSLTLHDYVKMALPEQVSTIIDPRLFHKEIDATPRNLERENRILECFVSIFNIGIACSRELPRERMNIGCAIKEKCSIKDTLMELGGFETILL